ncbi:FAD-binding oxidoreductase [Chitinophaga sp. S165]|uniref:NAD(P)/FAD-dependent oxidoreductase n=1 Tax=Chitinophaga sp. S165 TaxID=2135462 RepID=UPI000D70F144|nr:FAD-dependent oxidoreductase [Chitinophaga sp. S165]PWV51620.1 glycine/D-amino acid oxidase-like deaminating enzyme [Chitinophaga sp. S165]
MEVIIIGGGIIGLSSAFYLQQAGYAVTVIDRTDMQQGCSYGNAGYVCPSHFVPLATPGIVRQGLKWMLDPKSPFYIRPSLNSSIINWGWQFMKSATKLHVERSAVPLRDIALLSKQLYEEWARVPGLDFSYDPQGMLELFNTEENAHHAEQTVKDAHALGLKARLIDPQTLQQMEPDTAIKALGAIYFPGDAQLYPNQLMQSLLHYLRQRGVRFESNQEVTGFITEGNRVKGIKTNTGFHTADHVVVAAGVWSRELARHLQLNIPMVGGRGYSVTFEDAPYKVRHSVILSEARVAISPMNGNKIRFGGTMEITGLNTPPRMQRVEGILASVKRYFPAYDIPLPAPEKVWYGYRPCSADGLPHIGTLQRYPNVTVATGHSMLGISLGAATGKLVSELVAGVSTSMDITPFKVDRFS